jgi:hexokinase
MPYPFEPDFAIELEAIINDTTGTLIASQYVRPQTKIGVILGTGCNAAYMEDISCIGKLKDAGLNPSEQMAINCEWVRFKPCNLASVPHVE